MAEFSYKGQTLNNERVSGVIMASTQSECYALLKQKNIFAYSVTQIEQKSFHQYKLKATELAEYARQVGTMQSAGIPVVRAIDILKERVTKTKIIRVYDQLAEYVAQGNTISEAMLSCGASFPPIMIHMFQAGEANGRLDDAALKMAKYYDSEHKINTKIKGAMAYPMILLAVTVVITIMLFTFVLPQMFDLIESGGGEITGITAFVWGISNFLIHWWYLAILVALIVVVLFVVLWRNNVRTIDRWKIKMPKLGGLFVIIYTARFSRTLSSLYGGGVAMIDAVEMSAKTVGNLYVQEQFIEVVQKIRNGQSLSIAIDGAIGVEKKLISAIYVGEETGRLDHMLTQISDEYEFESTAAIERMLTYLEPAMLLFMGLIIGLVLMSVMTPMMQMYTSIA